MYTSIETARATLLQCGQPLCVVVPMIYTADVLRAILKQWVTVDIGKSEVAKFWFSAPRSFYLRLRHCLRTMFTWLHIVILNTALNPCIRALIPLRIMLTWFRMVALNTAMHSCPASSSKWTTIASNTYIYLRFMLHEEEVSRQWWFLNLPCVLCDANPCTDNKVSSLFKRTHCWYPVQIMVGWSRLVNCSEYIM